MGIRKRGKGPVFRFPPGVVFATSQYNLQLFASVAAAHSHPEFSPRPASLARSFVFRSVCESRAKLLLRRRPRPLGGAR